MKQIKAEGTLVEKLAVVIQHILGPLEEERLLEILGQRGFAQQECWDTHFMEEPGILDELAIADKENVEDLSQRC